MPYIFQMAIFILIATLLTLASSQTFLSQDLNFGNYFPEMTEQRDVPRFYVCGMQAFRMENWTPARQNCYTYCQRCYSWRLAKMRCCWRNHCDHIPAVFNYRRIGGIKITLCNHQNWKQQWVMGEKGQGDSLGSKMCPENTYVNGYATKLSDRDGLAGLIVKCTNPRKRNQAHEVVVFNGDGNWLGWQYALQFITGVSLKYSDWYVVGLKTRSYRMPIINSFEIKYNFPKDFYIRPDIIDNAVITNNGMLSMKKEIEVSFDKEYQRIWENEKRQLHGIEIGHSQTSSVSLTTSMGIPFIQSTSMSQMNSKTSSELQRLQISQGFKFGSVERFKIGQRQKDIVQVPPCTKYTVQQIVYITTSDIPYVLRVGYTNGPFQQYENINGYYKGVSTSKVQTKIDAEKICEI